ncbi:beta-galactosidase [Phenylobacterium sp.]|jgi:beta-galactosidase|uniref:beta-galactosidase n=1 Tax=Phenylobacterium sp. TaxID=1871053 RepID=UPI002E30DE75|nr:beta-galactosidase [Phenylobacterium sp.]HEX2560269.1 beta-galactosidase [Phenylobacterium sp.]
MKLGVCYYPEHWPEAAWPEDAARMVELGISWVRIAEFAWSRIEPEPGRFDWDWMDRAVDTLAAAGLRIVMCTPTATPPKWLVDRHPDMLAVDAEGRPRGFGSRRHYCFSSEAYRAECARITEAVARRYGRHPAVQAWQTDNEFGCHDTTISYSAGAAQRFRAWLGRKYQSPEALNRAWGAVFWSQEYGAFDEVEPPNLTVTEANPSHRLDYNRFASEEVASFNRLQVDIIRRFAPGRDVTHNFMGFYTEFDHFAVGRDLDLASWDSYPLGFLEQFWFSEAEKQRYLRQGHPDIAAFHHDLYRGVGEGRWWVMEQQPGPVNWARYNPAPLPGMVRAWTWEAFAHGAEVVSYFRWRQAPFAQEQMHAGLNRPDRVLDQGGVEAAQVAQELGRLGDLGPCRRASVALVFSYEADWQFGIQPHAQGFRWLRLAFEVYSALRRQGVDIDIVPPDADFAGYSLVVAPSLPTLSEEVVAALSASGAMVLLGPRSGSRTPEGHIPANLAPGPLQAKMPFKVTRIESLRPGAGPAVVLGEERLAGRLWQERIETALQPLARFDDGAPAWLAHQGWHYLATWPEADLLDRVVSRVLADAGLTVAPLEEGVRTRSRDGVRFAVNYAPEPRRTPAPRGARFLLGGPELGAAGVAAWVE